MTGDRPTIRLRAHRHVADDDLAALLQGIEEEGVPSEVTRHDELDPLVLAHEASIESRLGVGLGISLDYVVVTTEKLPAGKPYIATTLHRTAGSDRAVGANAARIVKRMPLIDLHEI